MARESGGRRGARTWQDLPMRDRRRIMRAVNRGQALDDRAEATMAVQVARRQQSFWRWAWVIGPLTGLIFLPQGVASVLAYALVSTLGIAALAWWRYTRAQRAETRNLEVATGARRGRRARGHIPGADDRRRGPATPVAEPVHRPPKPSRRKRSRGR